MLIFRMLFVLCVVSQLSLSGIFILSISGSYTFIHVVLWLVFLFFLIVNVSLNKELPIIFNGGTPSVSILIFFTLSIMLPLIGVFIYENYVHVLITPFFSVVIPLMILYFGFQTADYRNVLHIILIITVVINFIFSIIQFFGLYYPGYIDSLYQFLEILSKNKAQLNELYDIRGRTTGGVLNPNDLGFLSACLLGYFHSYRRTMTLMNYSLIMFMLVFMFLTSNSRGAFISIMLGVGYFTLMAWVAGGLSKKSVVNLLLSIPVLSLCIAFYSDLNLSNLDVFFERLSRLSLLISGDFRGDENLNARIDVWDSALSYICNNIFGTLVPPMLIFNESPDNQYIYIGLQGGIFYLMIYILMLSTVFIRTKKLNTEASNTLCWIILMIIVNGFTSMQFTGIAGILFWLFLVFTLKNDRLYGVSQ